MIMKLITLLLSVFSVFSLTAHAQNSIKCDFEDNTTGFITELREVGGPCLKEFMITDNPFKCDVNQSDKSLRVDVHNGNEITEVVDPETGEISYVKNPIPWWAGVQLFFDPIAITAEDRYLHVLISSNLSFFEFQSDPDNKWLGKVYPKNEEWFDHVIDLSYYNEKEIKSLRLATAGSEGYIIIDELITNNDPSPRDMKSITSPRMIENYEGDNPIMFSNVGPAMDIKIIDNDEINNANKTSKCLYAKTTRGGEWWHGIQMPFEKTIQVNENNRYLHIFLKSDSAKQVEFMIKRLSGSDLYLGRKGIDADVWVDHVIDLHNFYSNGNSGNTLLNDYITGLRILHLGIDRVFLVDEIEINSDPKPRGLRDLDIQELSFGFENSNKLNILVNQSISNQNDSNILTIEDNPFIDDINKTSKVLKFEKTGSCNWWEVGPRFNLNGILDISYTDDADYEIYCLHMMVNVPEIEGIDNYPLTFRMNHKDHTGNYNEYSSVDNYFEPNTWQDLVMYIDPDAIQYLKEFSLSLVMKDENEAYIELPNLVYYIDGVEINTDFYPRESLEKEDVLGMSSLNKNNSFVKVSAEENGVRIQTFEKASISIYSINGVLNVSDELKQYSSQFYSINSSGIYIIKAINEKGESCIQKLIIK